jgi:hypothetical protein
LKNLEGRVHLEDLSVDGRIVLDQSLRNRNDDDWVNILLRIGFSGRLM